MGLAWSATVLYKERYFRLRTPGCDMLPAHVLTERGCEADSALPARERLPRSRGR